METIVINDINADKIFPAYNENNIPICLFSSDYYAPFCGTLVYSIIANSSPENNYDIIILERDISDRNKQLMMSLITTQSNFSIRFLNMSSLAKKMTVSTHMHFSLEGSIKLFLLTELFSEYDKMITTDSDLVFENDAALLYSVDVSGKYMAAVDDVIMKLLIQTKSLSGGNSKTVPKLPAGEYIAEYLHMGSSDVYFNTGVVVFNLQLCREDGIFEKAFELINTKPYWFLEQDVLNEVCGSNSSLLDLRWNVLNGNGNVDGIKDVLSVELREKYLDSLHSYYIMHFAGSHKPWNEPFLFYSEIFFKYARNTPWYEFIMYKLMNTVARGHVGKFRKEVNASNSSTPKGIRQLAKRTAMPFINLILPKGSERRRQVKLFWSRSKNTLLLDARKEMLNRIKTNQRLSRKKGTMQAENLAALKGLKNKYAGRRCFIVGTGPSLTVDDLNKLNGEITFSLNSVYKMFEFTEWRPTFYVCNDIMLNYGMATPQQVRKETLLECLKRHTFGTVLVSSSPFDSEIRALYKGHLLFLPTEDYLYQLTQPKNPHFGKDCSKRVFAYGTTVYLIFQLAVYMGFSEIYLLGTDCTYMSGAFHAYNADENDDKLYGNTARAAGLTKALQKGFFAIRDNELKLGNVHVYNATRGGELELFPRVNLDAVLSLKGE